MSGTGSSLELARKVLRIEAAAILGLVDRINDDFERAVQLLFECRGRVIVTGMGKSGLICRKIAATLSSTGTSAWFLHPAEGFHGDVGIVTGVSAMHVERDGKEQRFTVRYLAVYAKTGGLWRMTAWQSTKMDA